MKARIATLAATFMLGVSATPAVAAVCEDPLSAAMANWPPYQINADSGWKGIEVDFLNELTERMGCQWEVKEMPWSRGLKMIEQGKVDVGTEAGITEERQEFANFSDPYVNFQSSLWVSASDDTNYDSLKDFLEQGNKLRIKRGFEYGDKVNEMVRETYADQVSAGDNLQQNVKMLAAGRTDGTLGNPFVVGYQAKQAGVADKVQKGVTIQSEPMHIMFSKKSVTQETIEAANKAIAEMKKDGTIVEIVKKHTGTTIETP